MIETPDRVFVTLQRDAQGYPPLDEEMLWALSLGDGLFELDATPTFAAGLSHRDLVRAEPFNGRWYVVELLESRGHSTVRAILMRPEAHDVVLELGRRVGADVTHTEFANILAIDLPPDKSYDDLVAELKPHFASGLIDYDEGAISDVHSGASKRVEDRPTQ